MKKKLPLVEIVIDPTKNKFVSAISVVENPAFESNFISFSDDKKEDKMLFSTNEERMELLGVALIPDKPIYRYSQDLGEYLVTFSKETIREIAQTFSKKGLNDQMNIEHTQFPSDSYVFQSYIVDASLGLTAPNGLEEAIDGSWVLGVKVENDSVWNGIKSGKINGFSVEGIFGLIDTKTLIDFQFKETKKDETLYQLLLGLSNDLDELISKGFL